MNEIAKEARKRLLDRRRVIEGMIGEVERNESALQNGTHSDVLDRAAHREPIAVLESLRGVHHGELAELVAVVPEGGAGGWGLGPLPVPAVLLRYLRGLRPRRRRRGRASHSRSRPLDR